MKRKPIKIDWDALEAAFNDQNEELVYYLDLVTGYVGLDGEGEESVFDDQDYDQPVERPMARASTTRLYVQPPDVSQKVEWMEAFLADDPSISAEVTERLHEGLESDDPAAMIGEILRDQAEVRDRWFLYRSDRFHELIDDWLEANEVQMVDLPPWRAA